MNTERDDEFADLMMRVQSGCDEASNDLLTRYGQHILLAVRRRLHQRLRSKFDSLDFVQDVWASFFADVPQKCSFDRPEALVAYLTAMARNKVAETVRTRMQRQKHNVNRERSLDRSLDQIEAVPDSVRTPSEIVMGREEWDRILDNQPLVHRRILALVREGKDPLSIARELGISDKTVRRVIQKNLPGVRL